MATKGWREQAPRTLKKLVYALTDKKLEQLVEVHKERGWKLASDVKEHGYGVAVLMKFPPHRKEVS